MYFLFNNDGSCSKKFGIGIVICKHQTTIYFLFWALTIDYDNDKDG